MSIIGILGRGFGDTPLNVDAPNTVTGYLVVVDEEGQPKEGVSVAIIQLTPSFNQGNAIIAAWRSKVSELVTDDLGQSRAIVSFSGLWPGGKYRAIMGDGEPYEFVVPLDAEDPFPINSILGDS